MSILFLYFTQKRPNIRPELVEETSTEGGWGWEKVVKTAMGREEAGGLDTHFIKGEKDCTFR